MAKQKSVQQQKVEERVNRVRVMKNIEYDCRENCLNPTAFTDKQEKLFKSLDDESLEVLWGLISKVRQVAYKKGVSDTEQNFAERDLF